MITVLEISGGFLMLVGFAFFAAVHRDSGNRLARYVSRVIAAAGGLMLLAAGVLHLTGRS